MLALEFGHQDIDALGRGLSSAGKSIAVKSMARAMRRMTTMARTRVVREGANRTDMPVGKVRAITTAHFNAGGNSIEVVERSGWIALAKLSPRATRKGVTIPGRGSYNHAFIAMMKSGHYGVFRRVTGEDMDPRHAMEKYGRAKKQAIRELFGANPAHDVTNNPDEYLAVMAELIETQLAPRYIHELDRMLAAL
ncbi:putative Prophage LambdaW5, minor tail protein Z [uncultured Pleomorphomonas sp.]|uniref:Putative Prophage LambdaW5, minor tail protein Z n=1 Tax=uncultured Pleomorphomonas sp. TaxID=442121 RepID=A0A212L755_9HYPH|nr:putative Prophage LambdaW5, minor tail protein Z [uncultured Pleomorphomonas sp.]